ncbi:PDR/VanB family oxidoreductase [Bacillus sp. Marseille-Q1617]|uniref:PDR/VanB family oxidoreductase n=1 Tax=Bacillus sp. Marseille-Q1617 TaxID=2736887 RepID=UPI00158A1D1A|nr:PDR/VanB family oxidoreductase [Bacillus sp. Marseille-Q1617]
MKRHNTIPVSVASIKQECKDVKVFTLRPEKGSVLPPFGGGAHITTYIEKEEEVIARSYSLTNHADDREYRIAIRLNEHSRGGSACWHHHIKTGDRLRISFPKNYFPLSFRAKHHVLYAAGIGITPFLAMMKELAKKGSSFELHYVSKARASCPFYTYLKENYPHQCSFYFSEEHKKLHVTSLLHHPIGTHVYFCGPQSFIEEFREAAKSYGYPSSSIHFERFAAPEIKESHPFHVVLTSGKVVHVGKDQSLLDALLEEGIPAPYSCRMGRCGTCELKVIHGRVEHYDSFLSVEEKKSHGLILPCVSRAGSKGLLLDIE